MNVLQIEKVVYQRELARRIGLAIGRTAIFVAKQMEKDGEIEMSEIEQIENVRIQFMWRTDADKYDVERLINYKKNLLTEHMLRSTVQKSFGPRVATSSLIELADNNILPLDRNNITGPVRSWAGPNRQWANRQVMVGRGDIDVIALEKDGKSLVLGEVKMRSDRLNKARVRSFIHKAAKFEDRVLSEKGTDYRLKIFMLCPLATQSAIKYSKENDVKIMECKYAYYPSKVKRRGAEGFRDLRTFYEEYGRVMGVRNLKIVSYPEPNELPISEITGLFENLMEHSPYIPSKR